MVREVMASIEAITSLCFQPVTPSFLVQTTHPADSDL